MLTYTCLCAPACPPFLPRECPSQRCTLFYGRLPGAWHLQQEGGQILRTEVGCPGGCPGLSPTRCALWDLSVRLFGSCLSPGLGMCSLPSSAPSAGQGWRLDATHHPAPLCQVHSQAAPPLPPLCQDFHWAVPSARLAAAPPARTPLLRLSVTLPSDSRSEITHSKAKGKAASPGTREEGQRGESLLTYCPAVPGEDGAPGSRTRLARGSHGEEASDEFLFKFFIPAEKASLGRPRSRCAASPATEQTPAGMSSPGYGLMA